MSHPLRLATKAPILGTCLAVALISGCRGDDVGTMPVNTRSSQARVEQSKTTESSNPGSTEDAQSSQCVPKRVMLCAPEPIPESHDSLALVSDASGDVRIDSLNIRLRVAAPDGVITYSFFKPGVSYNDYTDDPKELSAKGQENAREIFRYLETIIPIRFTEVQESANTAGVIRIRTATYQDFEKSYAGQASYPSGRVDSFSARASDVRLNIAYDHANGRSGFQMPAGSWGYSFIAHEIGHALGLLHPSSGSPPLPTSFDNWAHTMMSYTRLGAAPAVLALNDVLALRYMYGEQTSFKAPATVKFSSLMNWEGNTLLRTLNPEAKNLLHFASPLATLDMSGLPPLPTGAYHFDLKPGGRLAKASDVFTSPNDYFVVGTVIALHTTVQDIVNSQGSDQIYANTSPNVIRGYHPALATGHDTVYDLDGSDTLDLRLFKEEAVTKKKDGDDLILELSADSSVKLIGYLKKNPAPAILYKKDEQALQVSIAAGVLTPEPGEGGYRVSWGILLSEPAPAPLTFNFQVTSSPTSIDGLSPSAGNVQIAAGAQRADLTIKLSAAYVKQALAAAPARLSLQLSNPPAGIQLAEAAAIVELAFPLDKSAQASAPSPTEPASTSQNSDPTECL